MMTGLLPNRGDSPAKDDYVPPAATATTAAPRGRRGRSPRTRISRRRRRAGQSNVSAAPSQPTNANSIIWTFLLAGLLGTVLNIAYVASQTALKGETDTTTADYTMQHAEGNNNNNDNNHLSSAESKTHSNVRVKLPEKPQPIISVDKNIDNAVHDHPDDPFYDKGPLIELLKEAEVTPIDNITMASLPTWSEITSLYGREPIFYGLDTCTRFQGSGIAARHFLATAGTFNTGTNLLSEMLLANCHMPARQAQYGTNQKGIRWQVLWGKHTPVRNETFRRTHRTYNDLPDLVADDIFAAVMVRDPYRWMQSMCRHSYGASWLHDGSHCPSLVPNEADRVTKPHLQTMDHIPVHVQYSNFVQHHDSLAHFWSEWYQYYLDAKFPFMMIRFEDLIYHPKKVVQTVCECAGGQLNHGKFKYVTDSAKKGEGAHGKDRTGYTEALSRYGRKAGRTTGMEDADLDYAKKHLDHHLMGLFGYLYHDEI